MRLAFSLHAVLCVALATASCGEVETIPVSAERAHGDDASVDRSPTRETVGDGGAGATAPATPAPGDANVVGARYCVVETLQPFDDVGQCFDVATTEVELCSVTTVEYQSASIGRACGADPKGRVYVIVTRPDTRLEATGWRFGHRRDRQIYTGLEPDTLTLEERAICQRALDLMEAELRTAPFTCSTVSVDAAAD